MLKRFSHLLSSTEALILCIINGNMHPFISVDLSFKISFDNIENVHVDEYCKVATKEAEDEKILEELKELKEKNQDKDQVIRSSSGRW